MFKKESKINLYRITEIIILLVISQIARGQDNFLKSRQVAPGVIHYHDYRQEGPWHIHVIEIDRKNPWIRLETVKAGNKLTERDKTSVMISRYDTVRHHVVCAINGDFYEGNGVPVGAQVSKGILLKKPTTRSVFGVSENGIPFIDIVSFEGSIWTLDGTQLTVDGINENQSDSTLIIYNSYFGERTQTEPPCLEILYEYLADNNFVNDTSYVQVLEMDSISAFHELKRQDLIISIGQNKKSQLAGSLHLGDTLAVLLNLIPAEFRISELIGGTPRLIRDGAVSVEWEKENDGKSFTYNRHPRTAVGISADSMRIFFVTVDGRQKGYSAGMSLFELAEYMQSWGIKQAVNLDGGGSTTMVVRGNIVNSPSDLEGERAVSSALMVVSTAPLGPITRLQIEPEMIKMLKNMPVNFSVTGYDQYFNPHRLETDKIGWSCDPNIGYIDQNGRFISGNKKGSGYIHGVYKQINDSVKVWITHPAEIRIKDKPPILALGEQFQIAPSAFDSLNKLILGIPEIYDWSLSKPVGKISNHGIFTAQKTGDGVIYAGYGPITGSISVSVRQPRDIILEEFTLMDGLSYGGMNIDSIHSTISLNSEIFLSAPTALRLDYAFANSGMSSVNLNLDRSVENEPLRIGLSVYGDGNGHRLRAEIADADSDKFILEFTDPEKGINWEKSWKYLEIKLDQIQNHWSNPEATINYPITWSRIYLFETNKNKKDSGTIYIDDLKAVYLENL